MVDSAAEGSSAARAIAFYLPQFHPTPENDEWWGPGFTEWNNVVKARPRFDGHYQPHEPGELGFYDLRVAETREAQARLAREHGIEAFCYYHYWFEGRRLLNRVFDEVVESGSPDLPFCLCWANEDWRRNWDASTGEMLVAQTYSESDDEAHIAFLLKVFSDPRYVRVDDKPVFLIYRAEALPDLQRLMRLWRTRAEEAGFAGLYLCAVNARGEFSSAREVGLDALIGFMPTLHERVFGDDEGHRSNTVVSYQAAANGALTHLTRKDEFHPSVMVGWDNSARRQRNAVIFDGDTPELYERWLKATVKSVQRLPPDQRLVFIIAWNEWAEGNHLEPDVRFGRRYLEATRRALRPDSWTGKLVPDAGPGFDSFEYGRSYSEHGQLGRVARLVDGALERGSLVIDLGAGAAAIAEGVTRSGHRYIACERDPEALAALTLAGIANHPIDLVDTASVIATLNRIEIEHGPVGAILLLDVIEHLTDPHLLLTALSEWARTHAAPWLVLSVPHVAHRDIAIRLLLGRWDPTPTGLLDATHLRFFYESTLSNLVTNCGWCLHDRDDVRLSRSDQFSIDLLESLPWSAVQLLLEIAAAATDNSDINQFLWVLRPVETTGDTPTTYLQAVQPVGRDKPDQTRMHAVEIALNSRGYMTAIESETYFSQQDRGPDNYEALIENGLYHLGLKPSAERDPAVGPLADIYRLRGDLRHDLFVDGTLNTYGLVLWALQWGVNEPGTKQIVASARQSLQQLAGLPFATEMSDTTHPDAHTAVTEAANALGLLCSIRADVVEYAGGSAHLNPRKVAEWALDHGASSNESELLVPHLVTIRAWLQPPQPPETESPQPSLYRRARTTVSRLRSRLHHH